MIEENLINESISEQLPELKLEVSDDELISMTSKWLKTGEQSRSDLKKRYEKFKKYYLGNQLGNDKQMVDNRTFLSAETINPIATASLPVINVLPYQDTIESRKLARMWEKILMDIYDRSQMQKKLERACRYLLISNYAVFKYYYDEDCMEVKTRVIHPDKLIFNNDRDISDGFDWIGEYVTECASELIEKFPNKKKEISELVAGNLGTEITYIEFWTENMVIWRYNKLILGKAKNPNYNYTKKKKNHFFEPQVPYVAVNLFDLGETIAGETSLIEQVAPLQDGVNKRKSQIDKNANIVNGKVIGSGMNGLKKEEFASIDWSDSEEGIFMSNGEVGDIIRQSGSPLPAFVENDMMHSISEIDNIMGTHSTTRGEREGRETATGRQILRESDRGRIDIIGRRFEEALHQLFEGWTQIVRVYYTAPKTVTILNVDGSKEFLEYDQNSIEDGIEIKIVPGTLIPEDKASRRATALQLASAGLIDPITLFREMGYKNPEEMAKNLYLWQNDPMQLFTELQEQNATKGELQTNASIQQAEDETRRLMAGQPVPPYEMADANHIEFHASFMEQPDFEALSPDIQQMFLDHVQAEAGIVEDSVKQKI